MNRHLKTGRPRGGAVHRDEPGRGGPGRARSPAQGYTGEARERFERQVMGRSGGRCVFCAEPAVDAHHILERKLFADGGYHPDNGAAVCAEHHWACETTAISVEEVRRAAGVSVAYLPIGWEPGAQLDKWGNRIRPDGMREPGPLFSDTGCRRALAAGGFLGLFVPAGTPGVPGALVVACPPGQPGAPGVQRRQINE